MERGNKLPKKIPAETGQSDKAKINPRRSPPKIPDFSAFMPILSDNFPPILKLNLSTLPRIKPTIISNGPKIILMYFLGIWQFQE